MLDVAHEKELSSPMGAGREHIRRPVYEAVANAWSADAVVSHRPPLDARTTGESAGAGIVSA